MKKTRDYLLEAKQALGHETAADTVRWLGLNPGVVSRYLSGKSIIDNDDVVWKIADALNVDPSEIVAARAVERAERSNDTEMLEVWKRRFQAVSHSAATIFGLIALPYGIWLTDRLCILC